MKKYEKRPLEVLTNNISNRKPWKINVDFNYMPPGKGKALKQHRAIREELNSTIPFFTVLADNELFKILQEIDKGNVPLYYKDIVTQFYQSKLNNTFVSSLVLGCGEKFDLENDGWIYV